MIDGSGRCHVRAQIFLPNQLARLSFYGVREPIPAAKIYPTFAYRWGGTSHAMLLGRICVVKNPLWFPALQVEANQIVRNCHEIDLIFDADDIGCNACCFNFVFPAHRSRRSVKRVHMPEGPVSPYNNKVVGNQRVAMKLALFSILADVIVPLYLSSFLVERANHAIAGASNKKVARDRGRGENSATSIEYPEKWSLGGRCGCIPCLSREQPRRKQKNHKS